MNMMVTLSQAPQNGWETWFSLQYGTNLSKLQAHVRKQKAEKIKPLYKKLKAEH